MLSWISASKAWVTEEVLEEVFASARLAQARFKRIVAVCSHDRQGLWRRGASEGCKPKSTSSLPHVMLVCVMLFTPCTLQATQMGPCPSRHVCVVGEVGRH